MPSVCHRQDCVPTRFLLRFTNISGPARWSTCPDKPAEFARKCLVRFTVLLITPNNNFQDLGADLAMSLQRRPKTPARRPILGLGRGDTLVRRARIPITIENVERRTAIVEAIRADGHSHAIDRDHAQTVVTFDRSAACGKTNIGPMHFNEARRRSAGKPSEKIHRPLMAILAFPGGAASFIEAKKRFGFGR